MDNYFLAKKLQGK